MPGMNLIERAKNLFVTPKTEWDVIAAEPTLPKTVVTGYVLPLAAIAAIAGFIGAVVVGTSIPMLGTVRSSVMGGLVAAIMQLVMAVASVFVMGFIIDALAPTFGGQKNFNQAIKVAAYSYTPVWVLAILAIIPYLGMLIALISVVFAIYLLYLGLPRVMHAPQEKAAGYTVVVVIVGIVVGIVLAFVVGLVTAPFMMATGGYTAGSSSSVTFDKDSPMGKLDDFSKKMEAAGKQMEAAQKSGDANKQAEAALAALGAAVSGGKGVEPVTLDKLTPFVPEKFAGLARTDMRTERSGVAGLKVAKAEATYGSGDKSVELEVVDTGGAAGLMGLATWAGVQSEREDSNRRESTRKEGNRMIHEEVDKQGGSSKYTVVVADRFVVSAEGNGVDIGTLKAGVNAVNLGALEGLK
jgi:hypothetical protein